MKIHCTPTPYTYTSPNNFQSHLCTRTYLIAYTRRAVIMV